MRDGFLKVSAVTPKIRVADPKFNAESILEHMRKMWENHTKICVFPELCLTAYSCNDLFLQTSLLEEAKAELKKLVQESEGHDMLSFVGLPWKWNGRLYNVSACIQDGNLLGLVPKTNLPNYGEFYEGRYFSPGVEMPVFVDFYEKEIPLGTNLLFRVQNVPDLLIGVELCEDLWVPAPPSVSHALAGATVIINCSASNEVVGKRDYRRTLVCQQSARLHCAYIYANAGEGESTQDLVFGGHNVIAENGAALAESPRFVSGSISAEIDVEKLAVERRKKNTFLQKKAQEYRFIDVSFREERTELTRKISAFPFVPETEEKLREHCEEVLTIQALGLKKRLEHIHGENAVLGISGGLDSTLALLVTTRAFDLLGLPRERIRAVTMPCFGTTDRTYQNACELTKHLGATLEEVRIHESVLLHFRDIGQDPNRHDVTYENAQARERTQILMDIANRDGALLVGTGDLSELVLGWATYNGDHMSMYGVNASVPKTLVRHLVQYCADRAEESVGEILRDILNTPVSPELLPPKNGTISQRTEDLVGPYELHDFYLYYALRFGFRPRKIYRMAVRAFSGIYDDVLILKWLKTFYRRFFSQQFKRSCLPDGPKVGSVSVSPRGDLRMPSDAVGNLWIEELDHL